MLRRKENPIKKTLSLFAVIVFILSLCPVAFAAENSSDEVYRLYEEYEHIISEANDTYGCALYLLPFEEMENFGSVEEFRAKVISYCESRNVPITQSVGTISGNVPSRGVGVVTIPNVKTRTYSRDTVTITFYGTFDVRAKTDGSYYIYSQNYIVYSRSANGIILYAAQGNPTTKVIDGGRTILVTQQFKIYVDGQFGEDTSVMAGYIVNFSNGNITAS